MSQRHQAFIVARVVPSRGKAAHYQCIGALHDQWCYDYFTLEAARRFITLISQPGNSEIIREELRGIERLGQNLPEERYQVPCPFTQFLFLTAWGVSLDDPANPRVNFVSSLEATMGLIEGDNDDGLTIIDVTDPENATCCFIASIKPKIEDLVLITAEQYVSNYIEEDDSPERQGLRETLIRSFDDVPLMSVEVFEEAWSAWFPEEKGSSKTSKQPTPVQEKVSSLVQLTLRPAIEQAITESTTDNILDFVLMDPTRVALAKDIIRSQNQVSDGAFSLLQKLVSADKDKHFDLSGFSLSGKQVVDLLAVCGDSEIVLLNLSHNPNLRVHDLQQILQRAPQSIRRLVLLDSGVSDEEMVRLLDTTPQLFVHLESIIHPAFLSGLYEKNPVKFTPRFTHVMFGGRFFSSVWTVSLPYFTPNTLAQGLTDFLSPIIAVKSEYAYSLQNLLTAMAAYAACSRTFEHPWGERTVAYVPRHDYKLSHPQKGEWTFVMVYKDQGHGVKYNRKCYYTIIRLNKAGEEFFSDENTSPETLEQFHFLRPDLVDVFDIRGFFKAIELEGRPSPDPKVFQKLLDLFPVDGEDNMFTFLDCEAMKEKLRSK